MLLYYYKIIWKINKILKGQREMSRGLLDRPSQVYVTGRSWTAAHRVHSTLDPSCEPSQMHENDLIQNIKQIHEEL